MRKRFCRRFNFELQAAALEDSIVLSLGAVHSFALEDVVHYLSSKTVRDVLTQAVLDAPLFGVYWRWNASTALAVRRFRNGKKQPAQFQRMDAEDLLSTVFPDQLACAENLAGGDREIPDHPLVKQTLEDCLTARDGRRRPRSKCCSASKPARSRSFAASSRARRRSRRKSWARSRTRSSTTRRPRSGARWPCSRAAT